MKTNLPIIALIAFGSFAASAEEAPDLKKSAYQTGASQDQLRGETRRVKEAIQALREEFHEYRSMQGELSMLESAMRDLAGLEEHDMPDTSAIFKEASRLDDQKEVRRNLINGSLQQKKMQVILREIADRLYLQRDLVMMRSRYHALAMRQATNIRDSRRRPEFDSDDNSETAVPEQMAIAREIAAAGEALEVLANNGPPLRTKTFAGALAKANDGKLTQTAEDAALTRDEKIPREVPEKKASQATLATLKSVIAALDEGRSPEDRTNELVRKLDELLKYQESLAKFVPNITTGTREGVSRGQGYLSDEMDLAQDGIAKLQEEAAQLNSKARERSEDLVGRFDETGLMRDRPAIKSAIVDQLAVAADIKAARDLLQKKAEELAKENSSPEMDEFMNSLEQMEVSDMAETMEMPQEMRDLIKMLLDAKAKIKKAKEMLKEKKDPKAPKEQVEKSGKDLKDANETAGQLEGMIPPEVAEHIRQANKSNGEAAAKLGNPGQKGEQGEGKQPEEGPQPGEGEGQEPGQGPQPGEGQGEQPGQGQGQGEGQGQQSGQGQGEGQGQGQGQGQQPGAGGQPGADLDQAEAEIDKALEALKKMMMMGMGPGQGEGEGEGEGQGQGQGKGKGQGQGQGQGKGGGEGENDGRGQGGGNKPGKGKAKRGENTPSGIQPVEVTERDSKRDALMLLEKEKAPAEYEQMVDQYIRNLGKGDLPTR